MGNSNVTLMVILMDIAFEAMRAIRAFEEGKERKNNKQLHKRAELAYFIFRKYIIDYSEMQIEGQQGILE